MALNNKSNDNREYLFMNVYSDDQHTTIEHLGDRRDELPLFSYMAGDFNCHSKEWDSEYQHHGTTAILLLDTATALRQTLAEPSNPGYTFRSADPNK